MTTLLLAAALTAQTSGSAVFNAGKHVIVLAPKEFVPSTDLRAGQIPAETGSGPHYAVTGYKLIQDGGLRTIEYTVTNQSRTGERDSFLIRVRFLSEMGRPPQGEQLVKGDPCYVQDGRGAKQWVFVESVGQATFTSRFSLKTPHYAPTTPDTMVAAEGVGKAIIRERSDGKFDVALTTYLFHKGNRRDYYMLAGTLKP
jgi:hypothetical protein